MGPIVLHFDLNHKPAARSSDPSLLLKDVCYHQQRCRSSERRSWELYSRFAEKRRNSDPEEIIDVRFAFLKTLNT